MMKAGCSGRRWACLPVYIGSSRLLCGQNQNLAHLRWRLDFSRVAWNPGRAHRLFGDAVEMLGADPHILQAARQAETADEGVEHVAGVLAGLTHRRRNQ